MLQYKLCRSIHSKKCWFSRYTYVLYLSHWNNVLCCAMTMGAGADTITATSIQWIHRVMDLQGMWPQVYKEYSYGGTDTAVWGLVLQLSRLEWNLQRHILQIQFNSHVWTSVNYWICVANIEVLVSYRIQALNQSIQGEREPGCRCTSTAMSVQWVYQ